MGAAAGGGDSGAGAAVTGGIEEAGASEETAGATAGELEGSEVCRIIFPCLKGVSDFRLF